MVKLVLILLAAIPLLSCGHITIGPVDTSCHVNPNQGDGSGCSRY
jgi:hypothetical protein